MSGIIDTVGSKSGIVGSDVYPAGHVLQVQTASVSAQQSIVSATADIASKTFNRIKGISKFIINSSVSLGQRTYNINQDSADPKIFWNINGTDYSSLGGKLYSNAWYSSTVPSWIMEGATYSGTYEIYQYSFTEEITSYSSGADGDSIVFKVRGKAGSLGMYVNQPMSGGTLEGSGSYITIWEVVV